MSGSLISIADANAAHHPQSLGARVGRHRRAAAVHRQAVAGQVALDQHAARHALGAPLPTAATALAWASTQLGKRYRVTSCRCDPQCYARDCSGLVIFGVRQAGLPYPCTSSFAIAQNCRAAGTLLPVSVAIWIPGAIGIRNPWGTPNGPSGSNGHIVYFTGRDIHGNIPTNPADLVTVEEMGTRYGCVHGPCLGRFDVGAYFPGLDYTHHLRRDPDMIIQQYHYDGAGKPAGPASRVLGKDAYWVVAADGTCLEGRFGASMANDQEVKGDPKWLRRFVPSSLGSRHIVGATFRPADSVDGHDGVSIALDDGDQVPGHFS